MAEINMKNSLLGITYQNNNYYIESYDINKNYLSTESINHYLDDEEKVNLIKEEQTVKNEAFCFICKKNINLNLNNECKNHNIKYLNDINKDINIELIENRLDNVIKNYNEILKSLEEKIKIFKIRNDNEILLAKKIIELYKSNINNLNYQIILNAKNILNFNEINLHEYIGYINPLIFDYNILKEYNVFNHIKETIHIKNIQKNFEINFGTESIDCFISLENKDKIIYNTKEYIYLLNTKNFIKEDKIKTDNDIILMNLMNDKETILISYPTKIEKLNIINNKLIKENFINDINVYKPGVIINYQDYYAWTNGQRIGFNNNGDGYNLIDILRNYDNNMFYSGGFKAVISKLYQYENNIIFTYIFTSYDHHGYDDTEIKLGLYNKNLNHYDNFIKIEDYYSTEMHDKYDYNIFNYKPNKIIIFGTRHIKIIDVFNWKMITDFSISERIINNSYYLKDYCFLLFITNDIQEENKWHFYDYANEKRFDKEEGKEKCINNILVVKIKDEYFQNIYEGYTEFKTDFVYLFNKNKGLLDLESKIIAEKKNRLIFYDIMDVNKSLEFINN